MPDTQRTIAALQALFPDNTSGQITPQRARDLIVSYYNKLDTPGLLAIPPQGGHGGKVLGTDGTSLSWVTGGGGGTSDHADLTNLGYAASGHTGFAGLDVENTFTETQYVQELYIEEDLEISGASTFHGTVLLNTVGPQTSTNVALKDAANTFTPAQTISTTNAQPLQLTRSNDGTVLGVTIGATSVFTMAVASGFITLGAQSTNPLIIRTANATASGSMTVQTGNGSSGASGTFALTTGTGSTSTGALTIGTGNSAGGASGNITLTAGQSTGGAAGRLIFVGGNSTSHAGGRATISGGNAGGSGLSGGNVELVGGTGTGTGGNISLAAGTGTAVGGNVTLVPGSGAGDSTHGSSVVLAVSDTQTVPVLELRATTLDPLYTFDRKGRPVGGAVSFPTIAAGAGAGTTPTVSVTAGSGDVNGSINVTTGTTPSAAAVVATVTFGTAYAAAPKTVILFPANAATANLSTYGGPFVGAITTTTFTVDVGTIALPASTALKWYYLVIG